MILIDLWSRLQCPGSAWRRTRRRSRPRISSSTSSSVGRDGRPSGILFMTVTVLYRTIPMLCARVIEFKVTSHWPRKQNQVYLIIWYRLYRASSATKGCHMSNITAYVQICHKSRRIGCVIPRCKLLSNDRHLRFHHCILPPHRTMMMWSPWPRWSAISATASRVAS